MLELLKEVRTELPDLMIDENSWQSLFIDYHPPTVSRLWIPWRDYRLCLHKIHPCSPGEALFHPHPWPSVMEIIDGSYQYAVGFGKGRNEPPIAQAGIASTGSSYEMTHPDAWHYVAPLKSPAYTIMLTGKPWGRWSPASTRKLDTLVEENKIGLLNFFRNKLGHKINYLSHEIKQVAGSHLGITFFPHYSALAHVVKCPQCQHNLAEKHRDSLRLPSD